MAGAKRTKSKGKKLRYSRKRKYTKRKYIKKAAVKRTTKRSRYTKRRPMMRRRKSYMKSSGPSIGEMSWVVNNFGAGGMASAPASMPRKYQRQMPSSSFGFSFPLMEGSEDYKSGVEI